MTCIQEKEKKEYLNQIDVCEKFVKVLLLKKYCFDDNKLPFDHNVNRIVYEQYIQSLLPRFFRIFQVEYNSYLEVNSSGNYEEFVNSIIKDNYLDVFCDEMKYLDKLIKQRTKYFISFMKEIEENSTSFLCEKKIKIKNIILFNGDSHNFGKFVVELICTDSNSYIYKPRSGDIDLKFQKFIRQFIPNYYYYVYSGENYSIHEKILAKQSVKSIKQVEDFYYNIGVFAGLFYCLSTTDMHFENVIVNEEVPFLIDIESLANGLLSTENAISSIPYSSLKSMLFPFHCTEKFLNLSITNGKGGEVNDFYFEGKKLEITSDGTIDFVSQKISFSDQKNRIFLNNMLVEPYDYYQYIEEDYKHFISYVDNNKGSFVSTITSILGEEKVRVIVKPTYIYGKFLSILDYPYYLMDQNHYELILEKNLSKKNQEIKIVEKEELLEGDIPFFFTTLKSTNIFSNKGKVVKDYFKLSIYSNLLNRIETTLNKKDIYKELENIRTALLISAIKDRHEFYEPPYFTSIVETTNLKEWYKNFMNSFTYGEDSSVTRYLPVSNGKDNFLHIPLTASLYNYAPNLLYYVYSDENYDSEAIKNILKTMIKFKTHEFNDSGGIHGLAGFLYLLMQLHEITKDSWYYDEIIKQIEDISVSKYDDLNNFDFLSGKSGLILAFSNVLLKYRGTTEKVKNLTALTQSIVQDTIDYVENNNYFSLGAGLGHGLSGIILALSRFSKVENVDRKLISQLVDYEDSYFSKEYGNYLDTRNNSYDSYFFCYGLPGIILSRIEAESIGAIERNYVQNLVNILINKVLDEGLAVDNTLCHGWFGIQDILLIASENGYLTKARYQEIKKGYKVIFQENEHNYFNGCSHIFLGNGGRQYLKLREEISIPSLLNLSYL